MIDAKKCRKIRAAINPLDIPSLPCAVLSIYSYYCLILSRATYIKQRSGPDKKIALIEPQSKADHVYSFVQMPRLDCPTGKPFKGRGLRGGDLLGRGSTTLDPNIAGRSGRDLTTTSTSREAYCMAGYTFPRFAGSDRRDSCHPHAGGGTNLCRLCSAGGEGSKIFLGLSMLWKRNDLRRVYPVYLTGIRARLFITPIRGWIDVEQFPVADLSFISRS